MQQALAVPQHHCLNCARLTILLKIGNIAETKFGTESSSSDSRNLSDSQRTRCKTRLIDVAVFRCFCDRFASSCILSLNHLQRRKTRHYEPSAVNFDQSSIEQCPSAVRSAVKMVLRTPLPWKLNPDRRMVHSKRSSGKRTQISFIESALPGSFTHIRMNVMSLRAR